MINYRKPKNSRFLGRIAKVRLRIQCEAGSVEVIWGLDIMLILNKQGFLERAEATKTAERIAEINRYIGKEIIKQFIGKLI